MRSVLMLILVMILSLSSTAQEKEKSKVEISGQVMTDAGYNTGQVNPAYFDVMRATQLPAFQNQYGTDGNTSFGVRQSRLGFKSYTPTKLGELQTRFEFDLVGMGPNAGQTTFHLLYAYIELGKIGVGHHWSLFSDIEGFPSIVEYWGPTGMSLCKNVQFRLIPLQGKTRLAIALERPGASADEGIYADRIELKDVKPRFSLPDLTAEFRKTGEWGYAELAGVLRRIEWVDLGNDNYDLSGKATGWGFNLSTNLNLTKKDLFRGQFVYGQGIENLMNDAPTDIGIQNDPTNPASPIRGVALPVTGFMAYLDHQWNTKFSSSLGFSAVRVKNSDAQAADAFRTGKYTSLNLLYHPIPNLMAGAELIWIGRENYSDGWSSSSAKIQLSVRYIFAATFVVN